MHIHEGRTIFVVYVDGTIIICPNPEKLDYLVTSLGMSENDEQHTFEIRDEGQFMDFFGIHIAKGINI